MSAVQTPEIIEPPVGNADGVAITPFTAVAAILPSNPLDELSIELARVVKAVKESDSGKAAGEIKLTLSVKKAENVLDAVVIKSDVTAKLPKKPRMGGLLFADDDGVLSERNPNQHQLFTGPRG